MSQSFKARISEAGIKESLDSAYDSADEFKAEFYLNPEDRVALVTGSLCQGFSYGDGTGVHGYPRED